MSKRRKDVPGTVYLLHFAEPIGKPGHPVGAQHYTGWTEDLEARLAAHAEGRGARIVSVFKERGIGFVLARTWENVTRKFERSIKKGHRGRKAHLCPVCNQKGIAS